MSYNDRRQQAIEQREARIPGAIRSQLARCMAHHAGEDDAILVIGLDGGPFKWDNASTVLARRLDLDGQELNDACWFLDAVIRLSLKAENKRRRDRDSRYQDERIGWM